MRTYGYRRSLAEANDAALRRPENRRIYAEQQIDWFYTELLKAQRGVHNSRVTGNTTYWRAHWNARVYKSERDLAAAHERHLKACAELGPASISTRRDGDWESFDVELRDAAGYIRFAGVGYESRLAAGAAAYQVAINLGLEVE